MMEKEKLNPCNPIFYWGFGLSLIIFFTVVLDCAGVLRLIMLFPSPKADKFKLWIAKITASGKNVMKIIANAVNAAKDTVRSRVGCMFMTEEKMQFNIADEPDFYNIIDGGYCFFPVMKILQQ